MSQSIKVARKLPSDQGESKEEINLIRKIHERSSYCQNVLVRSDLPESDHKHTKAPESDHEQTKAPESDHEHTTAYYLETIRNFLASCQQDKGKRDIIL